jgi:hypothetical protein
MARIWQIQFTDYSDERAKQVCGQVPNGRAASTPFLFDCLRNRGGCLLEETHGQGRITKQLFCVSDRARANLLCNGKYGRVDLSSQVVNRVQQERGTGRSFSLWVHGDPSLNREPLAGLDVVTNRLITHTLFI